MSAGESAKIVERLAAEANTRPLARVVSRIALAAADKQDARIGTNAGGDFASSAAESLSSEHVQSPFGNVLSMLQQGVQNDNDRLVLSALVALGVEPELPSAPESELALAAKLLWLSSRTPLDPLGCLDAALGEKAGLVWQALARIACDPARAGQGLSRPDTLVAYAALCASAAESARAARDEVALRATDPLLRALSPSKARRSSTLSGELSPAPHGPIATTLLTVTLVLFVLRAGRLLARLALAYRRPARLRLSERGLELEQRTELLGKVLRDRSSVVPLANLAKVTREVRYARVSLYAGLLALIIGSYFGMALFVDGVRVPGGSAPLIGLAMLCMALGLVVDFALSALSSRARGRCRIVVVPRKGRPVCIAAHDAEHADALLEELAEIAGHGRQPAT